jgi:hypothetical protein
MSGSMSFLGDRRGAREALGIPGFELHRDRTADNAGNLMANSPHAGSLPDRIEDIRANGHGASRDGAWRLDTDQAPPNGGFNTQIQLNNSAGAKNLRKDNKATSATCVLVQTGADRLPRYNEALANAHALSWNNHAQMILSIPTRVAVATTTWACPTCGHRQTVETSAPKPPCRKGNKKCALAAT